MKSDLNALACLLLQCREHLLARNVAIGFYIATSGSVSVGESKNVNRVGHSGWVGGTVHARLRLQRGSKRLRLDGSWHCRLDPTSNGG